jgi:antirestriction protein ArdC
MSKNNFSRPTAKALHVQVAEKLIAQLKAGTAPWQKPWSSNGIPTFELPYNAVTGNRYKGINTFSLLTAAFEDPRWMTYKQAAAAGWQVMQGEQGTPIQFVKFQDLITKRDETGSPVLDEHRQPVKTLHNLPKPIITNAWVFNAAQISGIPALKKKHPEPLNWTTHNRADALIQLSGANIKHLPADRAFYNPVRDLITLPRPEQFKAADHYYATLLHELGHWTGHWTRLDRGIMNQFGTEDYAREELRAEIASLLIGQELHIGHDPGQHSAYVDSWIKVLQDTPFEIHAAAADAEKILNYLLSIERKQVIQITPEHPEIKNQGVSQSSASPHLSIGEQITYNNSVYQVLGHLKQGRLRVEDLNTGIRFALTKTDGLYAALVQAKNHTTPLSETEKLTDYAAVSQQNSRGR